MYTFIANNIALNQRLCCLCKVKIEDEFHFILKCIKLEDCRKYCLVKLKILVPSFKSMSDKDKIIFIFNLNDSDISKLNISGINDLNLLRNMLVDIRTRELLLYIKLLKWRSSVNNCNNTKCTKYDNI